METKKNQVTRRKFIKTSASAAAVVFAAPYIIPKSIRGANDQINIAVMQQLCNVLESPPFPTES